LNKDDRFYLLHILECIGYVEEDTAGGEDVFFSTRIVRDAVMRNLQILAESSTRISEELQARYPETDWRRLRKFRHVAVHDYTGTDYRVVWQIITEHLPVLKAQVNRMLGDLADRPHS
jgi:uncharacterized protein with HEPN domain